MLVLSAPSSGLWIDVEAFELAARAARQSRELAAYRGALALYTGELLPEDRYEDWAVSHREQLRGLHLELLAEMAQLQAERGEYPAAVDALERVLACEPTNEAAHASLMRLHAGAGHRLAVFRELGDKRRLADTLNHLADTLFAAGECAPTAALNEESLAIFRELGDQRGIALALNNLGRVARKQGDLARAQRLCEEALALRRELGTRWGVAVSLANLAYITQLQGDWARAGELFAEGLPLLAALGDRRGFATGLEHLAELVAVQRRPERAAELLGAAAALREAIGAPLPPAELAEHAPTLATVRAGLGDEQAFTAAWVAGRALDPAQVLAQAVAAARAVSTAVGSPLAG
jgi:tetratricopeptide (TPR) repeat protein